MPFVMAVLSSMLYGVADFLGGMGSRRAPAVTVTAWFQVTGLAFLVLYACFAPGVTRASDLAWAAAAGVSGGAGVLLLYRALAGGTVSTAAPLISMIALAVPVLVGLGTGERPGVLPLAGIGLGVVAVALISAHGAPDEAAFDRCGCRPRRVPAPRGRERRADRALPRLPGPRRARRQAGGRWSRGAPVRASCCGRWCSRAAHPLHWRRRRDRR
jgi:uncharacterized membrane protein